MDTDDFLPISALNDLLFCPRRCAMHRIEQVWVENVFTLEGTHGHRRADRMAHEAPLGVRTEHGVLLRSARLRLTGKADIIEFRHAPSPLTPLPEGEGKKEEPSRLPGGEGKKEGPSPVAPLVKGEGIAEVPFPVEYKRGKRRRWDNDDVQLCAQALCLEEMLGVPVPAGAVFHIRSKRRRDIDFTPQLRAKTEEAARQLHELFASGRTPPPVLKPRCKGCSLFDLCMPKLLMDTSRITRYHRALFEV